MEVEELGEFDMLVDPKPDIHALFRLYNSLYFQDSLGACVVTWSTSHMTRNAGICHFPPEGGCEIRLSPFQSIADLKNTLLHEMIHAYLWFEDQNKDHSDHGPNFSELMNEINCSSIDDHQRPASGYNITVHHELHRCESCGDMTNIAINGEGPANGHVGKVMLDQPCCDSPSNCHRHEKSCSGRYSKIEEPTRYVYNRRDLKGKHKHHEDHPKESTLMTRSNAVKTHQGVETKDKSDARKSKLLESFFSVSRGDANQISSDNSSDSALQKDLSSEDLEEIELKKPNPAVGKQMVAGVRSTIPRKKRKQTTVRRNKSGNYKYAYTVMIEWLDWYANEEGDGEIEQLINKRTERRKKQKLLKNLKGNFIEDENMTDASAHGGTENIDHRAGLQN